MGKLIEVCAGDKFNRLTVLNEPPEHRRIGKSNSLRIFLKCRCDCGKIISIRKDYLLKKSSQSCGCLRRDLAIEKGKSQRTETGYLYWLYKAKEASSKSGASRRIIDFTLSFEEYCKIVKSNCVYCGKPPEIRKGNHHTKVGIAVPINSIDRVDSTGIYEHDNCCTSCYECNTMKHTLTTEDFLKHIKRIYDYNKENML